jgi:uncharacterized lipoprotein YehR (DUF1307 family)
MKKIKTIFFTLVLMSMVLGLHACGGHKSGSDDTEQESSKIYSLTVTDINIVRTAGQQKVPVGPLPVNGAQITVK